MRADPDPRYRRRRRCLCVCNVCVQVWQNTLSLHHPLNIILPLVFSSSFPPCPLSYRCPPLSSGRSPQLPAHGYTLASQNRHMAKDNNLCTNAGTKRGAVGQVCWFCWPVPPCRCSCVWGWKVVDQNWCSRCRVAPTRLNRTVHKCVTR